MKIIVIALGLLSASQVFAEKGQTVCGKFIDCATYQAEDARDPSHPVTREISFRALGDSKVSLEQATIDGSKRSAYSSVLEFRSDGTFFATQTGEVSSTGICENGACTMSIRPYKDKGSVVKMTSVWRFLENALGFYKFHVDEQGEIHSSKVMFTKVK
ncbi:MAG: hypothetical protein ACXVBE_18290 [Bdellovibrionota bacterium]